MQSSFPLFPQAASSIASDVDLLYFFILAVCSFFAVLVSALVVIFAVKFRRRHADEVGHDIHGSIALELIWTAIPFVLAMVMFFWGADLYFRIARPPADAMDVFVVGKQWMWKVQHPEGVREINELHVPLGRPVRITLGSEDVLHDYYIPAFRVKMDAVPGKLTTLWFTATKAGSYHIFCAEYCGTQHSGMVGQVIVMEPQDYEAWLAGGRMTGTPVENGERLFTSLACITCHKADSSGRGPILPTFQGTVSEENLLQLIAYIKTLKLKAPAGAPHGGQ
jgi:cytochrome c oxidase subunit 2